MKDCVEDIMRPSGSVQYNGLIINTCYDLIGHSMSVLEIGSYAGRSAEIFMKSGVVAHMTCIDSWENGYDDGDPASSIYKMSDIESDFDNRMLDFNVKVKKIKGRSQDVRHLIDGECFDVVYIDALHTYDGCKSDITNYISTVCDGGS